MVGLGGTDGDGVEAAVGGDGSAGSGEGVERISAKVFEVGERIEDGGGDAGAGVVEVEGGAVEERVGLDSREGG